MIIDLYTKGATLTNQDISRLNNILEYANGQIKRAEQMLQESGYSNDKPQSKHRIVEVDFKRP